MIYLYINALLKDFFSISKLNQVSVGTKASKIDKESTQKVFLKIRDGLG